MMHFSRCVNLYKLMKCSDGLVFILASYLSLCKEILFTSLSCCLLFSDIQQLIKRKHFNFTLGYVYENHRFNNYDGLSIFRWQLRKKVLFWDYNSWQTQSKRFLYKKPQPSLALLESREQTRHVWWRVNLRWAVFPACLPKVWASCIDECLWPSWAQGEGRSSAVSAPLPFWFFWHCWTGRTWRDFSAFFPL